MCVCVCVCGVHVVPESLQWMLWCCLAQLHVKQLHACWECMCMCHRVTHGLLACVSLVACCMSLIACVVSSVYPPLPCPPLPHHIMSRLLLLCTLLTLACVAHVDAQTPTPTCNTHAQHTHSTRTHSARTACMHSHVSPQLPFVCFMCVGVFHV